MEKSMEMKYMNLPEEEDLDINEIIELSKAGKPRPLEKWAMARWDYLIEHNQDLLDELVCLGTLYPHLQEINLLCMIRDTYQNVPGMGSVAELITLDTDEIPETPLDQKYGSSPVIAEEAMMLDLESPKVNTEKYFFIDRIWNNMMNFWPREEVRKLVRTHCLYDRLWDWTQSVLAQMESRLDQAVALADQQGILSSDPEKREWQIRAMDREIQSQVIRENLRSGEEE